MKGAGSVNLRVGHGSRRPKGEVQDGEALFQYGIIKILKALMCIESGFFFKICTLFNKSVHIFEETRRNMYVFTLNNLVLSIKQHHFCIFWVFFSILCTPVCIFL